MSISVETARVLAVGGSILAVVLGGGLAVSVAFAATMPIHEPIKATLARIGTWSLRALSVVLRAFERVRGQCAPHLAWVPGVEGCLVWPGAQACL